MQQDGATKREHLEAIAKQTGTHIEELDMPDIPVAGIGMMKLFYELKGFRGQNAAGNPMRISNQEILAWCKLNDYYPSPFELDVAQRLDRVSLNTWYELQRRKV